VAGSLGGVTIVEAVVPRSRVDNVQKRYVDKGIEIKVLVRKNQDMKTRMKVALWWATMNNLPYDILQFLWFPLSGIVGRVGIFIANLFSKNKRLVCSELIASGFYKENDYLFGKPQSEVVPADFDDSSLFDEVSPTSAVKIVKVLPGCDNQNLDPQSRHYTFTT
jgi:hypothetical protein